LGFASFVGNKTFPAFAFVEGEVGNKYFPLLPAGKASKK
jgi:hypothetical protein